MREPSLPSLFAICERLRQLAYVTAAILDDVDFVTVVYLCACGKNLSIPNSHSFGEVRGRVRRDFFVVIDRLLRHSLPEVIELVLE